LGCLPSPGGLVYHPVMSASSEPARNAPCPSGRRQFLVMLVLYGGVQAMAAGIGLSQYGARWALVGVAVGLGAGLLFAGVMMIFVRYRGRELSPEQVRRRRAAGPRPGRTRPGGGWA
jgi:hypothetical protein